MKLLKNSKKGLFVAVATTMAMTNVYAATPAPELTPRYNIDPYNFNNIEVQGADAPVIYGATPLVSDKGSDIKLEEGVVAYDADGNDITSSLHILGHFYSPIPGRYNLIYQATDSQGRIGAVVRSIIINDPTGVPQATFSGLNDKTIVRGTSFDPMEGVTLLDPANGSDLTSTITVKSHVNIDQLGRYLVEYTATTSTGETIYGYRMITVKNDLNPVIYGVKDETIKVGGKITLLGDIKAFDAQGNDITKTGITIIGNFDTSKPGIMPITYFVRDNEGREIGVIRYITIVANA